MAELDYDHFDGGYSAAGSGHRFGRYAHLGGAVLSVALVISGAIWAYQLAVRDVAGVPVIRAVVDPMRLAPSNPGGSQALHQGLSVNAVAAAGTALPLPESLTLAPRPMELAEEDQAGLEPLEPVGGSDVVAMAPALAPVEPLVSQSETDAATAEALPATRKMPSRPLWPRLWGWKAQRRCCRVLPWTRRPRWPQSLHLVQRLTRPRWSRAHCLCNLAPSTIRTRRGRNGCA